MTQIDDLVNTLTGYYTLPHHQDSALKTALLDIQAWQAARIRRVNSELFNDPKTAPLANFIIHRIYQSTSFDELAAQLLKAGKKAQDGTGKLNKLIPESTLAAGILGVKASVEAIELDLALAKLYIDNHAGAAIDSELMTTLYLAADAKAARIRQIKHIDEVCRVSYQKFNSFLLQQAFALAKPTAIKHGYQPLYEFIQEGLVAVKAIGKIERFSTPFTENELAVVEKIHAGESV